MIRCANLVGDAKAIELPGRTVPVAERVDVLVCGGGPAGLGAAIAAAEEGAGVLLVEAAEALGGTASSGLVPGWPPVAGADGGVFARLNDQAAAFAPGARAIRDNGWASVNAEVWKIVCLDAVTAVGARVRFGTFAHEALVDGAGRVCGALVANKAGAQAMRATVTIDATGDGDLAVAAGAGFDKGRDGDGRLQAVSFLFKLAGVEASRVPRWSEVREAGRAAMASGALSLPDYVQPHLGGALPVDAPGVRLFQFDTSVGIDASDPVSRTQGLCEGYQRVREVYQWLRAKVPGFERAVLADVAAQLGVRETRRIHGDATVDREDVLSARKYPDGIARGSFYMDLHDGQVKTPELKASLSPPPGDWYEIRYGALLPRAVEGLLVAGRCVSSTREANGSLRVQPTCMATGEAAGVAAAMAAREGVGPRRISGEAVRQRLRQRGAAI